MFPLFSFLPLEHSLVFFWSLLCSHVNCDRIAIFITQNYNRQTTNPFSFSRSVSPSSASGIKFKEIFTCRCMFSLLTTRVSWLKFTCVKMKRKTPKHNRQTEKITEKWEKKEKIQKWKQKSYRENATEWRWVNAIHTRCHRRCSSYRMEKNENKITYCSRKSHSFTSVCTGKSYLLVYMFFFFVSVRSFVVNTSVECTFYCFTRRDILNVCIFHKYFIFLFRLSRSCSLVCGNEYLFILYFALICVSAEITLEKQRQKHCTD